MFTHHVNLNLKIDSAPELARITEGEIIPLLRKQKGFHDVVTSLRESDINETYP